MKEIVTNLEVMVDWILLQLWYADYWSKLEEMPEHTRKEQVDGFKEQAQSLVLFIQHKMLKSDSIIEYKGIKVSKSLLDFISDRETEFQHPDK